jgi:hypothetical protein
VQLALDNKFSVSIGELFRNRLDTRQPVDQVIAFSRYKESTNLEALLIDPLLLRRATVVKRSVDSAPAIDQTGYSKAQ